MRDRHCPAEGFFTGERRARRFPGDPFSVLAPSVPLRPAVGIGRRRSRRGGLRPPASPSDLAGPGDPSDRGAVQGARPDGPHSGKRLPHAHRATVVAIVLAATVIACGPAVARVTPWRWLVAGTWATSAVWAVSLALIDGWKRGFVGRMGGSSSYLATIPRVTSVPALLHGFASHIVDGPGSWYISVAGDPPGALLTFVGLDRLGLRGPVWASAFCVVAGTSAAAAVLITVRALSGGYMARRGGPLRRPRTGSRLDRRVRRRVLRRRGGLGPDSAGPGAPPGPSRVPTVAAVGAGLLLGCSIYLDYGLILMGIPVAVVIVTRNLRPLMGAVVGALAVAAVVTAMGFWWFEGFLVRQRYWAGIATDRPYAYWVWANLASLTCAIGIAAATGLRRAFNFTALRARRASMSCWWLSSW